MVSVHSNRPVTKAAADTKNEHLWHNHQHQGSIPAPTNQVRHPATHPREAEIGGSLSCWLLTSLREQPQSQEEILLQRNR